MDALLLIGLVFIGVGVYRNHEQLKKLNDAIYTELNSNEANIK